MHATATGQIDVLRWLVSQGARINAKDDYGETALMKACKEGELESMKFFCEDCFADLTAWKKKMSAGNEEELLDNVPTASRSSEDEMIITNLS
jgi:ankyrin repeat protein